MALYGAGRRPGRRGSRVIDDTTKQVYGPKTSKYYYENDVFLNRITYHAIDTVDSEFSQVIPMYSWHNNLYQDLGNIGTSITPIFYQTPSLIGVTSGFNSYNLYWDDEQIRYFDTKSPYSNIRATLGGKGRSDDPDYLQSKHYPSMEFWIHLPTPVDR